MWHTSCWTAVTIALLNGTTLTAWAQSDSTAGAGISTAAAGPSGQVSQTSAGNSVPGNSPVQGPAGTPPGYGTPAAGSGGSLMPCSPGPPYTSLPCLPAKR
jgi:hypothetical protein